jgi:hypothetical protein
MVVIYILAVNGLKILIHHPFLRGVGESFVDIRKDLLPFLFPLPFVKNCLQFIFIFHISYILHLSL